MPEHYIIIGSGIAGLGAAEVLRQRHPAATITLISEEAHHFYSRPGLAYLLRGDIPEKQLFIRSKEDIRALNLNRVHTRVERLLCDTREVVLEDGDRLRYDRLLLATGALAVPPSFPGGDLSGVVKLDGLDDTRRILQLARRHRTAVVVGGGITALELAEGLNAQGMEVHYFLRGPRYWADVLDEAESQLVMDRLRHEGITLHTNTQVKQAFGTGGRLAGVETDTGKRLPCQVLAVAIGVRPRVDLAREAGLAIDKGVVVNQFLQTSKPDVFAAGDVAQVGRAPLDVLWPTALEQGRVAGANMSGAAVAYVKGVAHNVTMLTGLKVAILGTVGRKQAQESDPDLVAIARGDSESWRQAGGWSFADGDDVNRIRLFLSDDRIVGALVMGEQSWSRPLQRLIVRGASIAPIRHLFAEDGSNALRHLAEFYHQWERANGVTGSGPSTHS